jgi:hypothetical protein
VTRVKKKCTSDEALYYSQLRSWAETTLLGSGVGTGANISEEIDRLRLELLDFRIKYAKDKGVLEKSLREAKTVGGQEALDGFIEFMCEPSVAIDFVYSGGMSSNKVMNMCRRLQCSSHSERQHAQFTLDASEDGVAANFQFIPFDTRFDKENQPSSPIHSDLPMKLRQRGWGDVWHMFECARTHVNSLVDSPSPVVFEQCIAGTVALPNSFKWNQTLGRPSTDAPIGDERLREIFSHTSLQPSNWGIAMRAAVELCSGKRFDEGSLAGKEVRRMPKRNTFLTKGGLTFAMPNLMRVVREGEKHRDTPGVGCLPVRDDFAQHGKEGGPPGSTLGGPTLQHEHISSEVCDEFDVNVWTGPALSDDDIAAAAAKGQHYVGVRRNVAISTEPDAEPAVCFVKHAPTAIKYHLHQLDRFAAEHLHANPISADKLNPETGELDVTLRSVWWLDGSTKGSKSMTKICMKLLARGTDPGVADIFGADPNTDLSHALSRWLWPQAVETFGRALFHISLVIIINEI